MAAGTSVGAGSRTAASERESDASVIERSWHEPEAFAALFDRHADHVIGLGENCAKHWAVSIRQHSPRRRPLMHELDIVRQAAPETPPLSGDARHGARVRLFAAIHEDAGRRPARPRGSLRGLTRGGRWRLAVPAGIVATAVVAGAILLGGGSQGAPPMSPAPGRDPKMAPVSAVTVLTGAAKREREHEQAIAPRDDQFIYTKEIIKETEEGTGEVKTHVDENWHSVDGSKRGWTMEIGKGWWNPPLKANESVLPPQDWATLEKLPTDPDKLLIAVRDWGFGKPRYNRPVRDNEWGRVQFGLAGLLFRTPVMPEGLRPAAFEALSKVPGVKATPDERDAKGRTGIGVSYEGEFGLQATFIFAPNTYEYLGMRDVRTSGDGPSRKTYIQRSYLDDFAVVDRVKQRP